MRGQRCSLIRLIRNYNTTSNSQYIAALNLLKDEVRVYLTLRILESNNGEQESLTKTYLNGLES